MSIIQMELANPATAKPTHISHKGIVLQKFENTYKIHIKSSTACGRCRLQAYCEAGSAKKKIINAISREELTAGQEVKIYLQERKGLLAVLLAYIIPFFLFAGSVTLCRIHAVNELRAVAAAFTILVIYYIIIYKLSGKLQKQFKFTATGITAEDKNGQ
ncbi:MAG TPA: SoxR reducing system RseC family protein [Spirochaetota bacterium]|nr:SoxR reducing system RseC family protein [Spirochaetota bacterium]